MTLKKITRFISLAALFLIPVFPLIVANSFFFPFITGKAFYFRLFVEIAFFSWIILAFLDARYRPRLNSITVGVTVFALVALVADLLGVNPIRSLWSNFERMEGWITIIHLWAFFIVATSIFGAGENRGEASAGRPPLGSDAMKWWHRWFNASLVVAFVIALYGIGQLFGWFAIHQGSTRIDASLGNAIYMAVYMLFHAFLAAYFFFTEKQKGSSKFKLWVHGLLSLLFVFLLFQTATRGTILGLIGGVMLALFLYSIFGKSESKKSRWISAGTIGAIILVGVIFWANRDAQFVKDSEVLGRLASISLKETQTQARAYVWPMALTGWSQRPILGWGQDNFNYVFNANYNPKMYAHEQWFDRAHNIYLDWLVNAGLVGILAYLALYVLLFRGIWKSAGISFKVKCVLTGLVAGYMVHNVFVFDNLASYVFFFALLGFISSVKTSNARFIGGLNETRSEMVEYVVAPISIVALVAVIFFFEIRPLQANTRLIGALQSCAGRTPDVSTFEKALAVNTYVANQEVREQSLSCAGSVINRQEIPGPTKQAFAQLALNNIEAQIAATPKDARMYLLGGNFMNTVGQYDMAQTILEKGRALSPMKQSAILELVQNYFNAGKIEEAAVLLKESYESEPSHPQIRLAYAMALTILNREAEARTLFGDDPAIFNTEQMAQLYASLKKYDKAIAIYKALIAASPENIDLRGRLAQVQNAAGMKTQAIQTLRDIAKDHPEYKDQIDAAVKSVQ